MGKYLICACASRELMDKGRVARLAAELTAAGHSVRIIPDLCRWVEQGSKAEPDQTAKEELAKLSEETVIACYPRAVIQLLNAAGIQAKEVLDLRNNTPEALFPEIAETGDLAPWEAEIKTFPVEEGTDAWFPVIDRDRCIGCRRCYDFCLFGTYVLEDGKVVVAHPSHCKNNCPACARYCPKQAIIFPKYPKSFINGGLDNEEPVMEDIDTQYAEALRKRLEARRQHGTLLRKK